VSKTYGPDISDVATMMKAMETLHNVSMRVSLQPAGLAHDVCLNVVVQATTTAGILGTEVPTAIELVGRWPNGENQTMDGFMFRLLHQMDAKLSKENWGQLKF
jgi:hypothetical protein